MPAARRPNVLEYVLPVIDVKHGTVVHGIAGHRETYAPLQSHLVHSVAPLAVASQLCRRTGSRELYLADLDGIAGGAPRWQDLATLADAGIHVWLDAGIADASQGSRLLREFANARWIIGLESLSSLDALVKLTAPIVDRRIVFSLDLRSGIPITPDASTAAMPTMAIADFVVDTGIASLIVLDVSAVGTAQGLRTCELCAQLKTRYPRLELISGGGVRNAADVWRLVEAGCDRVLVASALHNGSLLNSSSDNAIV